MAEAHEFRADDAPKGVLSGTLRLLWERSDQFIYEPDATDPLIYRRGTRVVQPERMSTDGGSIPRIFWPLKNFSPWAYGPAYALHDWLFNRHRCHKGTPIDDCSFEEANAILDDAILCVINAGKADDALEARKLIRWAVDKFGRAAWDGECVPVPPPRREPHTFDFIRPLEVAVFKF